MLRSTQICKHPYSRLNLPYLKIRPTLGAIKNFKIKNDHFEVKKVENHGVEEVNQLRKSIDEIKTLMQEKPQISTPRKVEKNKMSFDLISFHWGFGVLHI